MRDGRGMSDHEHMKHNRLPNWARDGKVNSDRPDNERGCSSIYQRGRADKHGDQITPDGDVTSADHDVPDPIDYRDAEILEFWISQWRPDNLYRTIIHTKYYREHKVLDSDVDAAVRALLDLMADNRRVVLDMKRMGWT